MRRNPAVENRHDRMELANEAGFPKISFGSVFAGVLVAYGAFAILAAIAGGILSAFGLDVDAFTDNDLREASIASGVTIGVILFVAYLYGGYVAGRMARRAGAANGLLVFVLGILIAGGVGAAIGSQTGADALMDNLRSIGVPTSGDQFRAIGTVAGIAALVAMLIGSVVGGMSGERWHGKLLARALDPSVGATLERTETNRRTTVDDSATAGTLEHEGAADSGATAEVPNTGGQHFEADDDTRPVEQTRTMH